MLVSDVLNIVQRKSFGADENSPEIVARLLDYFNQAHLDLYNAIAAFSEFFLQSGTFTLTQENPTSTLNPSIKSGLKIVNDKAVPLKPVTQHRMLSNPQWVNTRLLYYITQNSTINLTYDFPDPTEQIVLSYVYVPETTSLNLNDELNVIYPLRLQYLLADGTFYHLCFAEEGTRPIRQQDKSAINWLDKIASEQASLLNAVRFSPYGMY